MRPLTLVLALARRGALGKDGGLPWRIPEDLRHFREVTRGHAVIMGRRTWDEVKKPLPERRNLVVSRDGALRLPGAVVCASLDEALRVARETDPEPCVIGGAELYRLALPLATRVELTEIDRDVDADTFFELDRTGFVETSRRPGETEGVSFVSLRREGA
ncbi:MAG: dihydrofolate reductase [Polyangiaceae bacterium]|nr:dihydrofolate reductase [Polyangiaceae bacterium]